MGGRSHAIECRHCGAYYSGFNGPDECPCTTDALPKEPTTVFYVYSNLKGGEEFVPATVEDITDDLVERLRMALASREPSVGDDVREALIEALGIEVPDAN